MKLPLQLARLNGGVSRWRSSEPFLMNDRAVLIHRPLEVTTYKPWRSALLSVSVKFWCQNTHSNHKGMHFLAVPPEDRVVCQACEVRAVMAGLPSSEELAGRHVHIGKMKVALTCGHGELK